MADFGIEYEIAGVPAMHHMLVGFRDRALNGGPVLAAVLADMRRLEIELFDTEGRGEWPELAETTKERKALAGYPAKILQATEALYDSLAGNLSAVGHVERITEEEVVYGTTIPWARYHQDGTARMPARPPVDVREEDVRRWSKMVHAYVFGLDAGEVAAAGGGGVPFGVGLTDPFGVG
jgi:phage gpG-like protein